MYCPGCRSEVQRGSLPDHLRICPSVIVHCPNEGCESHIKRSELPQHDAECDFSVCECGNEGCGLKIRRATLNRHQNECKYCNVPCPFGCTNMSILRGSLFAHLSVCELAAVPCPNNCGARPGRCLVDSHIENDCPLRMLKCNRQCQQFMHARDISTHDCTEMLLKERDSLKENNRAILEELVSLRAQQHTMALEKEIREGVPAYKIILLGEGGASDCVCVRGNLPQF